jgi:hypothetical protein
MNFRFPEILPCERCNSTVFGWKDCPYCERAKRIERARVELNAAESAMDQFINPPVPE